MGHVILLVVLPVMVVLACKLFLFSVREIRSAQTGRFLRALHAVLLAVHVVLMVTATLWFLQEVGLFPRLFS
ncbi:MAG TPA: hypothetical protein VFB60_24080 [Ktedonobacteraceae bacterium]|nr:hypothetical protein [Ktedonobacteraceae bacterium]